MGFIVSPLPALSLRPLPSGPSPRLRPGTATFRTRSVLAVPPGSNGFLRRGPVRRPDPRQPAGLLHPAAGLGVHHVSDSLVGLSAFRDPKVVDPKVRRIILCGGYPSKLSPPRQPDHAVTAPHPFECARVHQLACPPAVPSRARLRVATLRCSFDRPQGLVPPRSPLRLHDVAVVHRSMLPWALDQHVSDAAARDFTSRRPAFLSSAGRFASRFQPLWRPPSRVSREGKESRLCLAPSNRCWCLHPKMQRPPVWFAGSPKTATLPVPPDPFPGGNDRNRSLLAPVSPEGGTSAAFHPDSEESGETPVVNPEGSPPRRSVSPEGARSPAHRIVTPKSGIATQRSAPEGWHWRFELHPSILLRSPAYMMIGLLAADSLHPKVGSSARHSRASRRNRCAVPCCGTPEGIASARRTAWPPEGGSIHGS